MCSSDPPPCAALSRRVAAWASLPRFRPHSLLSSPLSASLKKEGKGPFLSSSHSSILNTVHCALEQGFWLLALPLTVTVPSLARLQQEERLSQLLSSGGKYSDVIEVTAKQVSKSRERESGQAQISPNKPRFKLCQENVFYVDFLYFFLYSCFTFKI